MNRNVAFWPKKKVMIDTKDLTSKLRAIEAEEGISNSQRYEHMAREKLLRRITHIANKTSTMYRFPLELSDQIGKGMQPKGVNVVQIFKKLQKEFIKLGFKTSVTKEERYSFKCKEAIIIIHGLLLK